MREEYEEEEYDDGQWAEYEAQQAAWTSQEDEKGTSSKDSSYIFIESTKNSPKDERRCKTFEGTRDRKTER